MYIFKSFKLAVRKDPFSWNTFRKIPFRIPKRSNPFEFLKEFYPEGSFFMKGFIPEGIYSWRNYPWRDSFWRYVLRKSIERRDIFWQPFLLGIESLGAKGISPEGWVVLDWTICMRNTSCGSLRPSKPSPLPKLSNLILEYIWYYTGL